MAKRALHSMEPLQYCDVNGGEEMEPKIIMSGSDQGPLQPSVPVLVLAKSRCDREGRRHQGDLRDASLASTHMGPRACLGA